MLPKPTVPEGSRKVLNGVEVYTRHNFTTERGNLFETMDGSYILPNGEPVEDKSLLESLPDPQRAKALAWWEKNFGDGGGVVEEDTAQPSVEEDLRAENVALKAQIAAMSADPSAGQESPELGKDLKEKETKRPVAKQKAGKESSVLNQMGISS